MEATTEEGPQELVEATFLLRRLEGLCRTPLEHDLLNMLAYKHSYEEIFATLGVGRSGIFRFRERLAQALEESDGEPNEYRQRSNHAICA